MRIWDVECEVCEHSFEEHPYNKFSPLGEDPYSCQHSRMNLYGVSVYCECQGYSSPVVISNTAIEIIEFAIKEFRRLGRDNSAQYLVDIADGLVERLSNLTSNRKV